MRHMFDPRLSVPMKEIVTVTLLVVWFCVVLQWCSVSFVGLGLRKRKGKTDSGEEKEGQNLNHTHMQIHINMLVRWHALDLPTLPSMWACFSLSLLHTPPPFFSHVPACTLGAEASSQLCGAATSPQCGIRPRGHLPRNCLPLMPWVSVE